MRRWGNHDTFKFAARARVNSVATIVADDGGTVTRLDHHRQQPARHRQRHPARRDHTANGTPTAVDTINFSVSGTITLVAALPAITNTSPGALTINGGNAITIDGAHSFQIFSVNAGATLSLQNLTIANANSHKCSYGGRRYQLGRTDGQQLHSIGEQRRPWRRHPEPRHDDGHQQYLRQQHRGPRR